MDSMIQRVSLALAEADSAVATYDDLARAAIEAMQEPTDAMLSAEVDGVYSLKGHLDALSAESVYQAMIDAALKEPTP